MDHFGQIVKFWLFLLISCKLTVLQKSKKKKNSQHIIVIFD